MITSVAVIVRTMRYIRNHGEVIGDESLGIKVFEPIFLNNALRDRRTALEQRNRCRRSSMRSKIDKPNVVYANDANKKAGIGGSNLRAIATSVAHD